jgi:hypothetical protein
MTVIAHLGAIPLEETLGSVGPALLVACGVASAQLRARLRQVRRSVRAMRKWATSQSGRLDVQN